MLAWEGEKERMIAMAPNKARRNEGPTGVEPTRVRLPIFGYITWRHPLGLQGRVHSQYESHYYRQMDTALSPKGEDEEKGIESRKSPCLFF